MIVVYTVRLFQAATPRQNAIEAIGIGFFDSDIVTWHLQTSSDEMHEFRAFNSVCYNFFSVHHPSASFPRWKIIHFKAIIQRDMNVETYCMYFILRISRVAYCVSCINTESVFCRDFNCYKNDSLLLFNYLRRITNLLTFICIHDLKHTGICDLPRRSCKLLGPAPPLA